MTTAQSHLKEELIFQNRAVVILMKLCLLNYSKVRPMNGNQIVEKATSTIDDTNISKKKSSANTNVWCWCSV